jgi:hypothetical protein
LFVLKNSDDPRASYPANVKSDIEGPLGTHKTSSSKSPLCAAPLLGRIGASCAEADMKPKGETPIESAAIGMASILFFILISLTFWPNAALAVFKSLSSLAAARQNDLNSPEFQGPDLGLIHLGL